MTDCAYIGCPAEAVDTVLAGATRVPACRRHSAEWAGRYPESADLVWPLGLAMEAPKPEEARA